MARCCRAVWTVETLSLSVLAMAVNSLPWLIISTIEFSRGAKRVQRLSQSSFLATATETSSVPLLKTSCSSKMSPAFSSSAVTIWSIESNRALPFNCVAEP